MRLRRQTALAFPLLLLIASSLMASEIEIRIKSVDAVAREQLGIPLFALAKLLELDSGTFVPREMIDQAEWKALQKLKLAGLVEPTEVLGLPDGQMPNDLFVHIVVTAKGQALTRAARAE